MITQKEANKFNIGKIYRETSNNLVSIPADREEEVCRWVEGGGLRIKNYLFAYGIRKKITRQVLVHNVHHAICGLPHLIP